jgi:uncharacterized protein YvpB
MFWVNRTRFVLPTAGAGDPTPAPAAGYELSVVETGDDAFTELVVSWNAEAPPGAGIHVEARARYAPVDDQPEAAVWSTWRTLGHWGAATEGETAPRSAAAPVAEEPAVRVDTDTLRLSAGYEATAFQLRLTLHGGPATPVVRQLAASAVHRGRPPLAAAADAPLGRPVRLAAPARSQMVERPEIAGHICSPTSVAMVLSYYGVDQPTEQVAAGVFDHGARIYGNWPFNVAYAAQHGMRGVVRHFGSMQEVERELQAGRPVIISVAYAAGELPESPLRQTDGHLIVITGVNEAGDFYVNDPAADPRAGQSVEQVYRRENLRRVFLARGGVGYVIAPEPADPTGAAR